MVTRQTKGCICLIMFLIAVAAFGQQEFIDHPSESETLPAPLLAQPNPVLKDVKQLYVVIVHTNTETEKNNSLWKKLQFRVERKLENAGIKIAPGHENSADTWRPLNTPELRINIDTLRLEGTGGCVFRIHTEFAAKVYLETNSSRSVKGCLWQVKPVMQQTTEENMPAAITGSVLEQIEAFINAVLVSKASPAQSSQEDANEPTQQFIKTKPPVVSSEKPVAVEYKYVASKNSKVFHRADCASAKRIAPKNLTGYDTTAAAIKAGKRPCKRCKP